MYEKTEVVLDIGYYNELLKKVERIDTIERMLRRNRYMSFDDVLTVLDIHEDEEENENEAV